MRAIVPVRMPLQVMRRNMRDELSLVIMSEYGRLSRLAYLATLDGTWKAGNAFTSSEEAIDAAHSYVARRLGIDKNGPRFLDFPVAMASKFPLSLADLEWARQPFTARGTSEQMALAMIAHASCTGGPDGKD